MQVLRPVILVILVVLALALGMARLHTAQAQAALHCPPQDHPVYAASLHQWLCGSSLTVGGKSR